MAAQTRIVGSGPFRVSLKHEKLCVVSIPPDLVSNAAWWLIREYSLDRRDKGGAFSSLLLDDDGLSIVCSQLSLGVLQNLLQDNPKMIVSQQKWKAFVITVLDAQFPGAVYHLADSLSSEGMSILHISTFESEVFLVQEKDVDLACSVLRKTEDSKELDSMRIGDRKHQGCEPSYRDGFRLQVLPGNYLLTKLDNSAADGLASCSAALTKLLLFNERYNQLEKVLTKSKCDNKEKIDFDLTKLRGASQTRLVDLDDRNAPSDVTGQNGNPSIPPSTLPPIPPSTPIPLPPSTSILEPFMCGLWQTDTELTLLLEENDSMAFPPDTLIISPQRWKIVKLCGRPIAFDETGIVSAMTTTQVQDGISLNISTATTNCTLVPEELLGVTLEALSQALGIPI